MSFFKDFKEDLTQAVNELVAEEDLLRDKDVERLDDDEMVNTLDESDDIPREDNIDIDVIHDMLNNVDILESGYERKDVSQNMQDTEGENMEVETTVENESVDEITEITKGTVIEGNLNSDGSINLIGTVKGNVSCKGKLIVSGSIFGISKAAEIFANNAKIEGDISSEGSVKVGNGSVIIGNVIATSAVIGGAVNGDIDVKGPVIVDATAVVMGNIKSRSVQINNGAVIEGFCSQCYSEIDVKSFFGNVEK